MKKTDNYPFDPRLLANLTKLYHKFVTDATEIIKNSPAIDFSKVEIEKEDSEYWSQNLETICLNSQFIYEEFMLISANVGTEIGP